MVELIVLLDELSALATGVQKELSNHGYRCRIMQTRKLYQAALDENPCLILLNSSPEQQKIDWQSYLADTRIERKKMKIPALGYSTVKDPLKRLDDLQMGLDAVITQSALGSNPLYQVSRHARPHDLSAYRKGLPEGILEGIRLFNERKFHPAHDAIEPIWLAEKMGVRLLYQGILQTGIAFYFIEKGKFSTALRMFACGKPKLKHFRPHFLGIDIEDLLDTAQKAENHLRGLGAEKISQFDASYFPTIKITAS